MPQSASSATRMGDAAQLSVPLDVQIGRGPTGTSRRTEPRRASATPFLGSSAMTDAPRTPTPIDKIAEAWVDTLAELDPTLATYIGRSRVQRTLRRLLPGGARAPRRGGAQDAGRARGGDRRRRHRRGHEGRPLASSPSRPRTPRGEVAPARPQRHRLAGPGHPLGLRPHADRDGRGLVGRSSTRLEAFPTRSRATPRRCARASPRASSRHVARSPRSRRRSPATRPTRVLRDVRRRRSPGRRPAAGIPRPRPRRQRQRGSRRLRRARRVPRRRPGPRRRRAGCGRPRAVRAALPPLPRGDDRPRRDLRVGHRGARAHGRRAGVHRARDQARRDRSKRPSPSSSRTRPASCTAPTRCSGGCRRPATGRRRARPDALRHPRADPHARVHDRADEGGRDLLHRSDRRLLASGPHVVVGARGRRPSSTPGGSSRRSTTRAFRATTCRSRRPSTTAHS